VPEQFDTEVSVCFFLPNGTVFTDVSVLDPLMYKKLGSASQAVPPGPEYVEAPQLVAAESVQLDAAGHSVIDEALDPA